MICRHIMTTMCISGPFQLWILLVPIGFRYSLTIRPLGGLCPRRIKWSLNPSPTGMWLPGSSSQYPSLAMMTPSREYWEAACVQLSILTESICCSQDSKRKTRASELSTTPVPTDKMRYPYTRGSYFTFSKLIFSRLSSLALPSTSRRTGLSTQQVTNNRISLLKKRVSSSGWI